MTDALGAASGEGAFRARPSLKPLTSLRFFAAAAIVIFHFEAVFRYNIPGVNVAPAVTLFFVLSGFILTYVYSDFEDSGAVRRFYLARFARIWPLHALTALLALVLVPVHFEWDWLIANLLLVQAWVGHLHLAMSFNGVAWTISNEAFFYLLFPLVIMTRRWLGLWWLGSLALVLVLVMVGNRLEPVVPEDIDFGWSLRNVAHIWPPVRFMEFLAGITAARMFMICPRPRFSGGTWTLLEFGCIGLATLTFVIADQVNENWLGSVGSHWFVLAGCFPVLVLVVLCFAYSGGAVSRVLSRRMLVLLGEISFATYMIHQVLAYAWMHSPWWKPVWDPLGLAVALVATYLLSWILWRYFERPARRRIRALAPPPARPGRSSSRDGARVSAIASKRSA